MDYEPGPRPDDSAYDRRRKHVRWYATAVAVVVLLVVLAQTLR